MKINIGDIFIIPLKENRYGYGQVVEFGALLLISSPMKKYQIFRKY
ncbi:Imm26 family immunity protein [Paenibacillus gallinarum]|uniref:Uncharacterized protein n=1 Tax=Paenibacillus gallinarum TaxID=2762232 RepID=A0ABR8T722_9BACL|nr:Imm26 family immunity protein [Paenibacillus gallinarum]MBD7971415.1 hypothetical protein [Paenibacillus gallinarum]